MPKRNSTSEAPPVTEPDVQITDVVIAPKRKKEIRKFIRIKNNLRQMIPLNIKDESGKEVGIEIPAYSERQWPDIENLGPDIRIKQRKKFLSILR